MIKGHPKLRGRIVEFYGTQIEFAKVLGVTTRTVQNKLDGRVRFNSEDVGEWSKLLHIDPQFIGLYFFEQ